MLLYQPLLENLLKEEASEGSGHCQRSRLWRWWQHSGTTLQECPLVLAVSLRQQKLVQPSLEDTRSLLSSAAYWVLSAMPHLWHTYMITSHRSSCVGWIPLHPWALPRVEGVKMEVLQQLTLMKLYVLALIEDLACVKDVNVHNDTRVWCLSFIICTNQLGVPLAPALWRYRMK